LGGRGTVFSVFSCKFSVSRKAERKDNAEFTEDAEFAERRGEE
jgi:hypothetical protein